MCWRRERLDTRVIISWTPPERDGGAEFASGKRPRVRRYGKAGAGNFKQCSREPSIRIISMRERPDEAPIIPFFPTCDLVNGAKPPFLRRAFTPENLLPQWHLPAEPAASRRCRLLRVKPTSRGHVPTADFDPKLPHSRSESSPPQGVKARNEVIQKGSSRHGNRNADRKLCPAAWAQRGLT